MLVVDDHESARETIAALLSCDGYDLHFSKSGHDALALLEERPVDLVLCDVMMPMFDGFDVCRAIKSHATWRFVPVALVTALAEKDDLVRGLEAGADDFLTKPVDRMVLRSRVRALLRIRKQYTTLLQTPASDVDELLRARKERLIEAADLSQREREVLDLLLLGRTHSDVATVLGITERTSKFHQANILQKLGAESRADLTRLFI